MRLAAITSFIVALLLIGTLAAPATAQEATPAADGDVTAVATGLTNPRGFTWSDDGTLHLALAGTGGETPATIDGAEIGVYGGPSSSVVTVENDCATPLVEGIPSGDWRDAGWIWGAHDVAFLDVEMYILSAGGGIDFGNPDQPTGVLRLDADGTTTLVADISTWSVENPPAFVPPDYNPSGSLYDMEVGDGVLWISEAVGGRIITVAPDGTVTLVADISEGHLVPTGMAMAPDGGVYVGFLTAIPYPDGGSKVVHISPDGTVTDHWTGLTAITDLAIGPDGTLYAMEMATGNTEEPPFIQPATGRVVRMTGPDTLEPVVTELDFPAYLEFGADGALYLTAPAFGPDQGVGQGMLLRIDLAAGTPVSLVGFAPASTCAAGDAATPAG